MEYGVMLGPFSGVLGEQQSADPALTRIGLNIVMHKQMFWVEH